MKPRQGNKMAKLWEDAQREVDSDGYEPSEPNKAVADSYLGLLQASEKMKHIKFGRLKAPNETSTGKTENI